VRGQRPFVQQPRADGVVGELRLVLDERAIDLGGGYLALGVHGHLDDHGEALVVFSERREIGREALGQHRKDLGRRVDRRRVGARVFVGRRAVGHERVHVGNRHEQFRPAAAERFGHRQLVQIARIVVVDRRPQQGALVADRRVARCAGVRGACFVERRRRELREQSVTEHRAVRDVLENRTM